MVLVVEELQEDLASCTSAAKYCESNAKLHRALAYMGKNCLLKWLSRERTIM